MMEINFIKVGLLLMTSSITVLGILISFMEKRLPVAISQSFRFGKFAYKGPATIISLLEVPKAWFAHFYVFATAYVSLVFIVMVNVYLLGGAVPLGFVQLLDLCVGPSRQATVSAFSSFLALSLVGLQCFRRLYETQCVSVFGANSKMNIVHYIVGYSFYAAAIGAIIAEAPEFANSETKMNFSLFDMRIMDIVGTTIFLWAWMHQFISGIILANLRKDHRGTVVTHERKVPQGDLFDYITSPHLFCEIVMYTSLQLVLWGNSTWFYVILWVICNQVQVAFMNHWWYKQTFKDYPKERKVVIPFIL